MLVCLPCWGTIQQGTTPLDALQCAGNSRGGGTTPSTPSQWPRKGYSSQEKRSFFVFYISFSAKNIREFHWNCKRHHLCKRCVITWGALCQRHHYQYFSVTSVWAAYLWPVRHLPLWSAALAKAHLPAGWLVKVMWQTQRIIDRGVQPRRKHLPAAHSAILKALSTGSRALAPTAGLPPADTVKDPLT